MLTLANSYIEISPAFVDVTMDKLKQAKRFNFLAATQKFRVDNNIPNFLRFSPFIRQFTETLAGGKMTIDTNLNQIYQDK